MSSVSASLYNTFFRSNAIMLTTVFIGAFGIQMGFDYTSDKVWDSINRGRQWKDIKGAVMARSGSAEEEEE